MASSGSCKAGDEALLCARARRNGSRLDRSRLERPRAPRGRHTGRVLNSTYTGGTTKRASGIFRITSWDDQPYDQVEDGPKLTRTRVTKIFEGDLAGQSTLAYLMVHRPDESASFVGIERVTGRLGDRSGTFVLQHAGTFRDGVAHDEYEVVPGSGTGELAGLVGKGIFEASHAERYDFTLDYDFE